MRSHFLLSCLAVVVLGSGCGGDSGDSPINPTPPPPPPPPIGQTVRLVYAIPPDRDFRPEHADAIAAAFIDIRTWYADQLGGATFTLYQSQPETCWLPEASDYYRLDTWTRVFNGVQTCLPVTYNSEDHRWVLYADVGVTWTGWRRTTWKATAGRSSNGRLGAGEAVPRTSSRTRSG
jgi:hypothetical protein